MKDMIIKAAQDPSCILAVTPDRGGSWWAALRPGGNYPWPSAAPINFATGSYTWDSFNAIQNTVDFSHDFTFEIEFECTVQESARIFYISSTESLFGLYQFSTGFVIFTTCLLGNTDTGTMYTEFTINPAGTYLAGRHVAKMVVAGNTATAYLDDVVIGAANAEYINRATPSKLSAPTSKCGYIYFMRLTDDTTGKVIWSYPSEAERVRLITKTNIRTDRGVFEAADETKTARIDTALDLRGKISDYTVFVEFEAANMDVDVSAQQLCGQGSATNMSIIEIAACMYYYQNSKYYIRHVWELGGKSVLFYTEVEKLIGRHQLASILQINETGAGSRAMMYLDGKLIHTADNDNSPSGVGSAEHFTIIEPANTTQTYSRKYGKIYSCLVFDRALTAAEIAAFGVRRPRNFAEKPMTWTDFPDLALEIDQTHDYSFRFEFKMRSADYPSGEKRYLMDPGSPITALFGAFYYPDGRITVSTGLFSSSISGQSEIAGEAIQVRGVENPVEADVVHVIELNAIGNVLSGYFDDGEPVVAKSTTRRTDLSIMNRSPKSSFDGNAVKIQIVDLTTGETVWRANHNDLFTY